MMEDKRVNLNGVLVHPFASADELMEYVDGHKGILVAINAGKIYRATEATRNLINSNIGYVDGVGALKALHKKGKKLAIRIPGCELWLDIIKRNYQSGAKFYFVGGKQEVIDDVVTQLQVDFPGINIVGYRNGYINDNDEKKLIEEIGDIKPDYVFVAMGSPKQELLMQKMFKVNVCIYQGLGGSFDLYTGRVKRAPLWFREHNLEGFYRMLSDLSWVRLKRYWDDIKFIVNVYLGKY